MILLLDINDCQNCIIHYLIVHVEAEILFIVLQIWTNWRNLQNPRNIENEGEDDRWQHVGGDQAWMAKLSGVVAQG